MSKIDIGNETEQYFCDLLMKSNMYKKVELVGYLGCKADLSILMPNDTIRYLQVKTLTKCMDRNDSYKFYNRKEYSDNMLIVMVNNDRNRFALGFYSDFKYNDITFTYNFSKCIYKEMLFTDVDTFLCKLNIIHLSTDINTFTIDIKKEYDSICRLKQFLEKHNLTFTDRSSNENSIDGYINNFRFQAKYVSKNQDKHLTYIVKSYRDISKNIKIPYSDIDFDVIIIELGGTIQDPLKYIGNFCIIPMKYLIEQNIVKTSTCKGKFALRICPPDYKRDHWSKEFWNNIKIFRNS